LTGRAEQLKSSKMSSAGFTYWQDGEVWLGYLDQYPDYMTQGTSLENLKEHLLDLYKDLSSGVIPNVRQHAELELA
jgi:predicted RNase H-like HicB family nuclease